jgi:hypothetical protein
VPKLPPEQRGLTPEQRTLRAQLAAHESWARTTDPATRTAAARKAANDRFKRQVRDEHPNLDDREVARRAEHLRRAHFARMALASSRARSRRRDGSGAA